MSSYELKSLPTRGIVQALAKAEQYRALNEPEDAESICRDVLAVDAKNQDALRLLGLALTDQFPQAWSRRLDEAIGVFSRLASVYEQTYYVGIAWERCAKAQLDANQAHNAVYSFEQALAFFAKAEQLAPEGTPDPVLRWNRCVRALKEETALAAALAEPRGDEAYDLGD